MAKVYGYCRCSTNDTKQDLSRQVRELKEMGATDTTIYTEYVSGLKKTKTELNKLLDVITSGDTLAVTEISRITRSTKQLCDIIDFVQAHKIKLVIKDNITIDCTNGELDAMTKAFLQMAGVFSELEHDMICSRVKSGVANARAKGKKIGRPSITLAQIPDKVKSKYTLYKSGELTKCEYAKVCGISRPTLDKYINLMTETL
ncbi:recombinase family protein [Ruminococcus sp.]|uniref:recombinase family protein n=1 Tax=Ruminococcus sp. TaxID=41978 RepID=UPI001B41CB6D|nr:recombinase family protein [Ruminococcus sp.]MBP5432673.1 recombinase family protein [Ruminococcus sp.]